ncbi:hypothetical protein L6R52_44455 [Myxococcota bacterium]|nr:hypothetical protein [Myxococcota bacterium]
MFIAEPKPPGICAAIEPVLITDAPRPGGAWIAEPPRDGAERAEAHGDRLPAARLRPRALRRQALGREQEEPLVADVVGELLLHADVLRDLLRRLRQQVELVRRGVELVEARLAGAGVTDDPIRALIATVERQRDARALRRRVDEPRRRRVPRRIRIDEVIDRVRERAALLGARRRRDVDAGPERNADERGEAFDALERDLEEDHRGRTRCSP